ncbi:hypothetical protein CUJ83_13630 [Methanocella sp. CWC-04]|uniref:Archaeal flagella protein FlaD/E domain-containing protein n=1 Tax=Methanooceanicella nereidis TaxID=2052831 RepID=A0AAP2W8A6_9EURY|nr:FlaD/FlaE family flagellar protein [Methanocella sp. CWC-04]MCD1296039.1 hypothetical protein [Methanocella sp. CWC-04]
MDQSAINKIIMDAEAEDPAKKLEKLEKEMQILKGSIKKLILDIREQMNNADNPFLNIQQFQAPAATPRIDGEKFLEDTVNDDEEKPVKKSGEMNKEPSTYGFEEDRMEIDEERKMLEDMRFRLREGAGHISYKGSKKLDPFTMTKLMEWTRTMLRKNGQERFNEMIDMYVLAGYIDDDMKNIIQKVSKLMETEPQKVPKKLDIKEYVRDLYTLYVILNPKDTEFDSRMLSVLLNSENKQ